VDTNGTRAKKKSESVQNVIIAGGINQEKKCPRCKEIKDIDEFHKNRKKKDGHVVYCKQCVRIIHQEIYINNKDKILEKNKEWSIANPEKLANSRKAWRAKNPEKSRATSRKSVAKWRSTPEGAEKNRQRSNEWRAKNPEKRKASTKNWIKNNQERYDKVRRKHEVMRLYGLRDEEYYDMIKNQDNKCFICGKSEKRSLSVDHNHSNKKVRKLLCSGCNHAIGIIEKGYDNLISLLKYLAEHDDEMSINILNKLKS
jgi:phage FluMu protein Com